MIDPQRYVPALRFSWLTRWYDPILRTVLKEDRFKALLVEQAQVAPGDVVLDLGCGTATLTIMLKRACPDAHIIGLDGDPAVLALALRKVMAAGLDIELRKGLAYAPPFPSTSFDRVVSSLLFHHLTMPQKRCALAAAFDLLAPGGELHVADWGQAQDALMRVAFLGIQFLDGFATTGANVRGQLIPLLRQAGFNPIEETHRERTIVGTFSLYRAVKPGHRDEATS